MRRILSSIAVFLLLVAACGRTPEMYPSRTNGPSVDPLSDIELWQECSRDQAKEYGQAIDDGKSLVKAASCFAILVEGGSNGELQLTDAQHGRALAEMAKEKYPSSGVAHYMLAYLTALEAEHDPLRGLQLVPVIEQLAKAAATLNPEADHGGAERLLAELYLRAPEFPVSLGDPEKAVIHYRRAYTFAPEYPENLLGLVDALIVNGEEQEACRQLKDFFTEQLDAMENENVRQKSLDLFHRICKHLEEVESM